MGTRFAVREKHHHPRRRRAVAGLEAKERDYHPTPKGVDRQEQWSVVSAARARLGRVGREACDFAAEISEVVLADRELEHLVDDGDKVSQGANRAERWSIGGA